MSSGNLFTGVGSGKPTPRTKAGGMFGYVPEAFEQKSLEFSEQSEKKPDGDQNGATDEASENTDNTDGQNGQNNGDLKENGDAADDEKVLVAREGPMVVHEAVSF